MPPGTRARNPKGIGHFTDVTPRCFADPIEGGKQAVAEPIAIYAQPALHLWRLPIASISAIPNAPKLWGNLSAA